MTENRNLGQYLLLSLKGMAMGAADIVPGVSGGTIAFITGIYEELIESISNINLEAFKVLKSEGLKSFWKRVNGTFFLFLLLGIGISLVTLATLVSYLLEHHGVLVWSFFFGLIVASIWLIGKTVTEWNWKSILSLVIGGAIAFYISSIQTVATGGGNLFIFISGAIAICAMILPGISGSFILVLLGSYHTVIGAIKEKELVTIGIFAVGCVIGILAFSRLLKFLFHRFKNATIALLTGFMVGALYKVWPWKINIGDKPLVVHSNGKEDWMTQNVWPNDFVGDNQLGLAILCFVIGLVIIIGMSFFAPKEK